ncbi:hypothetical protein KQX54_008187 [Cotesia glomerata]|uniref:Uncharacterized protein n=1 Tax=Cotesia glomerata TaxID=32391 RepID=A0AAV7J4K2_COTGL|nr:hypothetical protein KQX54_008187 [Cotesia glomerata]
MYHGGVQIGPYAAFSLYQQWHRRISSYKMSTTPCYQMLILDDASVVAALFGRRMGMRIKTKITPRSSRRKKLVKKALRIMSTLNRGIVQFSRCTVYKANFGPFVLLSGLAV